MAGASPTAPTRRARTLWAAGACTFTATAWGWFHMVIGLSAAVAGGFIFTGSLLARSVGVALAVLSALANFLWLPHYPLWGIIIIALDVLVIWGLTAVDLSDL